MKNPALSFFGRNPVSMMFLVAGSLFLLYHGFAFIGHFGFDDLHYAKLSWNLLNGTPDWNDHFSYRWVILGFTALSYLLLGINDFASSLPALLLTLLTLWLLCTTTAKQGIRALLAAVAVFTFNHWTLFYSDKLMPDVYVAFFSFAAILVYYSTTQRESRPSDAFLFSLALFAAILSKETVILLLPLLIWWLVHDIAAKKNIRFWITASVSGALMIAGSLFLTAHLTGDAFSRVTAIFANRYSGFCDYAGQPFLILIRRITVGLLRELTGQGMMAGFILLLPAFFTGFRIQENKAIRFWGTTALILLLSSNFMSITPSEYNPMCTDPRHYLFLIPVFATGAGSVIAEMHSERKYWIGVLTCTAAFSLLLISSGTRTFFEQLLPIGVLAAFFVFMHRKISFFPAGMAAMAIFLAIKPFLYVPYARSVHYEKQKDFVLSHVPENSCERLVTDEVQGRLFEYYNGFRKTRPEVLTWKEAELFTDSLTGKTALLTNRYTSYLSGEQPGTLPYFASNPGILASLVIEDPGLKMALYKTSKWTVARLISIFRNGFEKDEPFWTPGDGRLETQNVYSGFSSNLSGEYSATFRIPADSLSFLRFRLIQVSIRFYCMISDKTDAAIVISVDNDNGNLIWEANPLFPLIKAFGTWNEISLHQLITKDKLFGGSRVSVYIWNRSGDKIYTDDWEIVFSGIPECVSTDGNHK